MKTYENWTVDTTLQLDIIVRVIKIVMKRGKTADINWIFTPTNDILLHLQTVEQ